MQNKVFRFNLDIKEKEFKTDFNLVQLDNTSMLVIKLFDEGNKLETTKEDRAEIAIDKNDNTFCVLPCNLYENEVNCTLDSNALASPGWTNCEVRILNEGKVLTSARFKIYIRESIVNNEKIKSTSAYKALEGLINEAKIMQESLKKGESVIEDVNKIKENLTEIKKSILDRSKEIDSNLAVVDEKINLIKTYISKSETAIENLTNNQNKIENLSNLLTELEKIRLTLDEINNSINKANIQKVELDKSTENAKNEKISLDDSVENSKVQNANLKNIITEAEMSESSLVASTQKGLAQQSDLEKTISNSIDKDRNLRETNEKADLLKTDLNSLSQNIASKITMGESVKAKLEGNINEANKSKDDLEITINKATDENESLTKVETEAKNTEQTIRDLMSRLDKTEEELKEIIASGNLDNYVTDPKLREALKSYATKDDLSRIDVTSQLVDYAKKTEIPTKLSELQGDTNNRTLTEAEKSKLENIEVGANKVTKISQLTNDKDFKSGLEIQELINSSTKLKKEVVTSLPSTGKEDIIYLLKNKNDTNNYYTEYMWIGGRWEIIGDTKVDLAGYLKSSDIVGNLNSTLTSKPLSASMGRYLEVNKLDKNGLSSAQLKTNKTNINVFTDRSKSETSLDIILGDLELRTEANKNKIESRAKKEDIKTMLSEMTEDENHKTVTSAQINEWNNKVTKESGKALSSNDYTDVDKKKVEDMVEIVIIGPTAMEQLEKSGQVDNSKAYFVKASDD